MTTQRFGPSIEEYKKKRPHPSRLEGGVRSSNRFANRDKKNPLISIITIVYNNPVGLEKTIRSVDSQKYKNREYIIIDGGSTDGTIDIVRRYDRTIDYWASEPDEGISDAFNKGLALSTGDWILFLNSNDIFIDENVLRSMANNFPGRMIVTGFARYGNRILPYYTPKISDDLRIRACIVHQATIVHRCVFERFGGFDTHFTMRMDYDFWLRVLRYIPSHFVPEVFIDYAEGGASNQDRWRFYAEEILANKKNIGSYNIFHWLKVRNLLFVTCLFLKEFLCIKSVKPSV